MSQASMSQENNRNARAIVSNAGAANQTLWLYTFFFLSGFPALLYQLVWQRALFTIYGVNIESVTVIVTVFILGLGLGSLAGGRLSTRPDLSVLPPFCLIECRIGLVRAFSMPLFQSLVRFTPGRS